MSHLFSRSTVALAAAPEHGGQLLRLMVVEVITPGASGVFMGRKRGVELVGGAESLLSDLLYCRAKTTECSSAPVTPGWFTAPLSFTASP